MARTNQRCVHITGDLLKDLLLARTAGASTGSKTFSFLLKRFTVRTDHAALQWLLNFKNPEGQLAR